MLTLVFLVACVALIVIDRMHVVDIEQESVECNPTELHAAAIAGDEAARGISALPHGSMKREDAIIAIRARETELRLAGFPTAADSFAAAAERRLRAERVL